MIVQIKNNKYDVDVYDPDVMEAVEKCAHSIADSRDRNPGSGSAVVRETIATCSKCIDAAVGAGVSRECFGDKPKYDDCLLAFAALNVAIITAMKDINKRQEEIYKKAVDIAPVESEPIIHEVPPLNGSIRKPVRVE